MIQKTIVWVTANFSGLHHWPDAPEEVKFLRDLHRHKFNVKLSVRVGHANRAVEFFMLQKDLLDALVCLRAGLTLKPSMSCEMMAECIGNKLPAAKYALDSISVDEDGENGATIFYA